MDLEASGHTDAASRAVWPMGRTNSKGDAKREASNLAFKEMLRGDTDHVGRLESPGPWDSSLVRVQAEDDTRSRCGLARSGCRLTILLIALIWSQFGCLFCNELCLCLPMRSKH
ncbi:hypothetical protein BRADI_4g33575v3 [Brachypodium distachyon]|uniref:Uncharacterized protein n=1 Tax=Brachypodium distachyon TaxID=15368 RepID=A0A2K2CS21_BRADI|nr:hypothetical protein BRADI_4g33575v3 [Brachypodium distachyon]